MRLLNSRQHRQDPDLSCRGGPAPPGVDELGEQQTTAGAWLPASWGPHASGRMRQDAGAATERLREAREFLQAVPRLPDLQCAWLVVLFCASLRAQYFLRNVPPEIAADHARSHDDEVSSPRRPIGMRGRTHCPCCSSGALMPQSAACRNSRQVREQAPCLQAAATTATRPYRPGMVGQANLASVCRQSAAAARARK